MLEQGAPRLPQAQSQPDPTPQTQSPYWGGIRQGFNFYILPMNPKQLQQQRKGRLLLLWSLLRTHHHR